MASVGSILRKSSLCPLCSRGGSGDLAWRGCISESSFISSEVKAGATGRRTGAALYQGETAAKVPPCDSEGAQRPKNLITVSNYEILRFAQDDKMALGRGLKAPSDK
jgi:hypothetical protein